MFKCGPFTIEIALGNLYSPLYQYKWQGYRCRRKLLYIFVEGLKTDSRWYVVEERTSKGQFLVRTEVI